MKGVTFGELAIGELFEWRNTPEIQSGPPGPEPMVKATRTRYDWSKGYGTAEAHYPVKHVRTIKRFIRGRRSPAPRPEPTHRGGRPVTASPD